jgi:hypothetical protein
MVRAGSLGEVMGMSPAGYHCLDITAPATGLYSPTGWIGVAPPGRAGGYAADAVAAVAAATSGS